MPKPDQRTLLQRGKTSLPALLLPLTPRTLSPSHPQWKEKDSAPGRQSGLIKRAALSTGSSATCSGPCSSPLVPAPTPGSSTLPALLCPVHASEGGLCRQAQEASRGPYAKRYGHSSLLKARLVPALLRSHVEQTDSFTSATSSHSNFESHHPILSTSKNVLKLCLTLAETPVLGSVHLSHGPQVPDLRQGYRKKTGQASTVY